MFNWAYDDNQCNHFILKTPQFNNVILLLLDLLNKNWQSTLKKKHPDKKKSNTFKLFSSPQFYFESFHLQLVESWILLQLFVKDLEKVKFQKLMKLAPNFNSAWNIFKFFTHSCHSFWYSRFADVISGDWKQLAKGLNDYYSK